MQACGLIIVLLAAICAVHSDIFFEEHFADGNWKFWACVHLAGHCEKISEINGKILIL